MKKTTSLKLISATAVAMLSAASLSQAATVSYSGFQANVDAKQTGLPASPDSIGWRNATPVKTFDVDGDNILGTDGYFGRAGDSLPSYVTAVDSIGGGNAFGFADNPLDPTGVDGTTSGQKNVGFKGSTAASGDLFWFTITGSALDDQVLGFSIMFDTYQSGTQTYDLEQRDGGTGGSVITTATSGALNNADDGYDWATFTISGATAGDVFVLKSTRDTAARITYSQVAFDTVAVPEPSAFALLAGMFGLTWVMIRRR